jgi:hypothetical protein
MSVLTIPTRQQVINELERIFIQTEAASHVEIIDFFLLKR